MGGKRREPFNKFVFGTYDGNGCFWDYSKNGKVDLYFVRKPNRPSDLKEGRMYRLRTVAIIGPHQPPPVYFVDGVIR